MNNLEFYLNILQTILFVYLGGASLYLFFFAMAGLFYHKKSYGPESRQRHITIIFPAFREDQIMEEVIQQTLQQTYTRFSILLIADSFRQDVLERLRALPITTIDANFEISTKVNALKLAVQYLSSETEIVLVLDADNIPEPDLLGKVNESFASPFKVIQCHRMAKNINTNIALLDAISEEVNNHIFRQGHRCAGFSSALIGSAMAFDKAIFIRFVPILNAIAGFDKQLELELLRNRIRIEYLNNAYVLDEKVQNTQVFYKQRKRWIYAQLIYFGKDILRATWHLIARGNLDYFDKTIQFSMPPRIVLLGLLFLINVADMFFRCSLLPTLWIIALAMNIVTLLISIPRRYYTLNTLTALLSLPGIFFLMVLMIFRLKGTNKEFIHTEHTYTGKNQYQST